MLWLIWSISVFLSIGSIMVMLLLILRRALTGRRAEANAHARQHLLRALISFSQSRDRETLKKAILAEPADVALDAGFEFLALLRGDEHDDVITIFNECGLPVHVGAQLRKSNEAVRIHAAEMLAALRSANAVADLLSALDNDRSREVRIAAAIGLCDLGALPPLVITLRKIGVAGQRSRRLIELFKRFPQQRISELRDYAARADTVPFVKAAAIDALARTGDPQLGGFFCRAARDAAPDVAASAVRALGRIGHPDASVILAEAMASSDWAVRSDAAEAAGRLGLPAFIAPLASLLDDDAWTVRHAAAKAMRAIGPNGERALREIASNQSSRSQRTASLVLSEGPAV